MDHVSKRTAVVCDRYPLFVGAVEQVLRRLGVTVAGWATSADRALELVLEHRPDVLVTEIELGDSELDGLEALRKAREQHPTLKGIVLSRFEDTEHIEAAIAAGAIAYVVKTAHPEDVAAAIRHAFEHSIYLAGMPLLSRPAAAPQPEPATAPGLTRREREILQLVAEGYSNAQLAKMLWVTEQTIKFHLSNIYRKLDVANRTEASRWAQTRGLLPAAATGTVGAA